jgi:endo-1,4-beta-D-glucanase Y
MGYGMMIVVQMAGYDLEARKYFDGLNRYRKRFPSKFNKAFMCWEVRNDKKTRPNDSATDGDCNIAAALLVASIQWNDKRYAEEAAVIIEAVERDLIRKDYSLRLGDWDSDEEKHQACRPSDFATADFLLFYRFTGERIWLKVRDKSHTILAELQRNYAPQTGLVPDFAIRKKDGSWEPAFSKFMETRHDGDYHYNSCRVPWRIGCDALLNNSAESKVFCTRLSNWTTSAIPEIKDFKGGYKLSGKPLVNYDEPVYTAPIAVAAMAAGNVRYAQDGYEFVKSYKVDYFSDTINLFSLMVLTHNFWLPDNFALR